MGGIGNFSHVLNFIRADNSTQGTHQGAVQKLSGIEYGDGTYDLSNLSQINTVSNSHKPVEDFQKKYTTKAAREKALKNMTNAQIDKLIKASGTQQAKIYYSSFKKGK